MLKLQRSRGHPSGNFSCGALRDPVGVQRLLSRESLAQILKSLNIIEFEILLLISFEKFEICNSKGAKRSERE